MGHFIQISSTKFPVLPGERQELVNEETYGKALAEYLQGKLRDRGYISPFVCCEDWGWWVELSGAPFGWGVCVYARTEHGRLVDFVCACDPEEGRKWSWRRFRFVDTSFWVLKLRSDLLAIFQADADIRMVGTYHEFPL